MLDRDELAARFAVALAGTDDYEPTELARVAVGCTDALLAALVPVAPASGAPATEPRRTVGAVVRWRGQDHPDEEWLLVGNNKAVALKIRKPHLLHCGTNQDGGGDEFVRWATREECERHGLNYVARPLPGAPLAAPSRPEWVRGGGCWCEPRVRRVLRWDGSCPVVGSVSHDGAPVNNDLPVTMANGTWEPCAAPSPAATPAAWVPSVGDRVRHFGPDDGRRFVVTTAHPRTEVIRVDDKRSAFCVRGPWIDNAAPVYDGPATSSERAAAGLPVDESATKPVDREGLAGTIWRSFNDESPDRRFDTIGVYERESYLKAADAVVAFMAKRGAS